MTFIVRNGLLTLHLQVKGHLLCVVLVRDEGSVEAPLLCPHSDQREDGDVPAEKDMTRDEQRFFFHF